MSIEQEIEQVEISLQQAKEQIERAEALDRLHQNKDFRKMILEGYFKEEASRLVLLKGDINLSKEAEEHCDKMINGIGVLRAYFQTVYHFGNMAEKAIADHEAAREELLQEQLQEIE